MGEPSEDIQLSTATRVFGAIARLVPRAVVPAIVRLCSTNRNVALCLHRVGEPDPASELFPELTQRPAELDELVSYFAQCPDRLTMSFDDGYLDAVDYVSSRATRHPEVHWMINICPRKTFDRLGHSWDAWMRSVGDRDSDLFLARWQREFDSGVAELADTPLGDDDRYRLATVEQCLTVGLHPNVSIANHTDHHLAMAWLDDDELRDEITTSEQRFSAVFGDQGDLVLPFGCHPYVRDEDIARVVDATSAPVVWTVGSRPFPTAPAGDGVEVRPRFGWSSAELSPKAEALFIAAQCIRDHIRSRRRNRSGADASVTQLGESGADSQSAVA